MDGWSLFSDLLNREIKAIAMARCRVAARHAVDVSMAANWRRRWLETDTAAAQPMGRASNNRTKGQRRGPVAGAGLPNFNFGSFHEILI